MAEFRDGPKMLGQILVYSMNGCPHCSRLKTQLNHMNLPFMDISIDLYTSEVRKIVKNFTQRSSGKISPKN